MKKHMLSGLVALILASAPAFAQVPTYVEPSPDLGPQLQIALPGVGDYDLYDVGVSVELQFRDWVSEPWGYMLALGYGKWEANEDAKKPGANLYDFDGNVDIAPFGASLLYKIYEADAVSITLEGGLRYLAVDSKITARNSDQPAENEYDVDIDDSIVARFGGAMDYALNEDFTLSLGVTYQLDTSKGDLSTELGPGVDNSFESFIIEAALRMPL